MSDAIITVENLGKRYRLTHQGAGRGSRTLRETLTEKGASLMRSLALRNGRRSGSESAALSRREEFWALRNVAFEVKQGEVLGIIGRNGAGKSTLLKILSRITDPTEGRVRIRGRVASLLEVGTGFHPELTGRENVFLNGAILGMSRAEIKRKFDEIVDFSGVEKFLDTPVKRYSSGMYVRLAFAVAAHLEPEILIVDEVLAVGDAEFQKKCLGKMRDVSTGGRTVMFVSHNMTAIKALCSRAILLAGGKIETQGDVESVANRYLNAAASPNGTISWADSATAPGNDEVRLCSVRVVPDSGRSEEEIDVTCPLNIEVEYHNNTPGHMLNVSMVLYTQGDVCVLNTCSKSLPHSVGRYRATCQIPGGFLNDETYRVRILLVRDMSTALLDCDHLVSFELSDSAREGAYYGKWIGVVRPSLAWTNEILEADAARVGAQ